MTDCDDLIDRFQAQVLTHIRLAVLAETTPVAEMHIDLAAFSSERAQAFEKLCEEE